MSPKLNNIYIAELVAEIKKLNNGTYIGQILINKLLYADDILLISNVKVFAKENALNSDTNDNDFFVFGADFDSGIDTDHFQLGFTSKTLLKRIPQGIIFNCDGTYKIIKFGFPLIVFGVSDINRKFWPVGFMLSSHEQKRFYLIACT